MEKQILVPTSMRAQLARDFKCDINSVRRALLYKRNGNVSRAVRKAALERGGLIYTGIAAPAGYMPDVDTCFDHANGYMYQTIGNKVKLSLHLPTNLVTISVDGNKVAEFADMTTASWSNVLYAMQQMYNKLNA